MRFGARAPIQRNHDQLNPSLKVAAIKDRISRKKNRILENHMLEKKNLYKLLFHEYNRVSKFFISLFNWYAVKIQVLLLEKNLFTKNLLERKIIYEPRCVCLRRT